MSLTSDAIGQLTTAINSLTTKLRETLKARTDNQAKLDEANSTIDNLRSQLTEHDTEDGANAEVIEKLSQTLKVFAEELLASKPPVNAPDTEIPDTVVA